MPKIHTPKARRRRANARLRQGTPELIVQTFPVYARNDVLGQTPLWFITREERDKWLADGACTSMSRGKAVRLLLNLPPKTQPSASMGPSITEGCMDSKLYAMACAEAWRPGWSAGTQQRAAA